MGEEFTRGDKIAFIGLLLFLVIVIAASVAHFSAH